MALLSSSDQYEGNVGVGESDGVVVAGIVRLSAQSRAMLASGLGQLGVVGQSMSALAHLLTVTTRAFRYRMSQ